MRFITAWRLGLLAAMVLVGADLPSASAANRWEEMDYGPFITSSVTMHPPRDPETVKGVTVKGVTVRINNGREAVCFDTNLCRYAGGWTGGWLQLMGTPFDGTHRPPEGSRPAVKGQLVFETQNTSPGWANPGDGGFTDTREEPYLPLAKEWAHYRGLYIHHDHVVFSYTVGNCSVLETPWYDEGPNGQGGFNRTFKIGASERPITLLVCEQTRATGGVGPAGGSDFSKAEGSVEGNLAVLGNVVAGTMGLKEGTFHVEHSRMLLTIPAHANALAFKLVIGAASPDDQQKMPFQSGTSVIDVEQFTHGGPARYPQTVETKLAPGTGDGPYVVDTLTLPDENPWHAWMRVGGFDFFPDGKRAALSTWSGDVWIVSGIDDPAGKLTWKRFATGLFQPLGLKIVGNEIYALCRDQVTILHDLNGDGEADFYENFNNDISVTPNFHEFVFDLQQAPDGSFFFTKGAPLLGTDYFDPIGKHNGCVLHLSQDGKNLEVYATGLRAPNGTGMGPHGEVTCSDNQGIWTPVDRLNLVKKGGFYGCMGTAHRTPAPTDYDKPLCWLPYPDPDNSGGGQAWVSGGKWGPFDGSMLYLSYGKCSLFHVLWEEIDGVPQGGVVKFPLQFATGLMRARFNPADGQLYVAGLKGWQTTAQRDGALQRVRYTGKTVRDITAMHVRKDGIDLTFTVPLDPKSAADAENYSAEWWNYRWTARYGSDEYKVSDPKQKGREALDIKSAKLSADGKTVSLEIPGLKPVMQMAIKLNVDAADKSPIRLEVDQTINVAPK
ncbi:MAG TPA: DUF6797 domain-containing protein [Tepidisphaeraceae bacterium]|jgi:hypothetical protein|nr:DUF6797 domain-containing protein [Tepidisphaeraceae bacterium]